MSRKPESYFDKRTVNRNVHNKRITRQEYEQYLATLEDAADKSVPVFFETESREPEEQH